MTLDDLIDYVADLETDGASEVHVRYKKVLHRVTAFEIEAGHLVIEVPE